MTVLSPGISNQIIVRRHARGHIPHIPRAKAQFSLTICSRCVDCSLIIGMHTQADIQTVAGQIPIDRGCLVWSGRILTMRQTCLPLSEVVPGVMVYANRAVDLESVSTISRVVFVL